MRRTGPILLLLAASALAQRPAGQPEIGSLLTEIHSYEYGQSREPLLRLTRVVEEALASPAARKQVEASLLAFLRADASPAAWKAGPSPWARRTGAPHGARPSARRIR